MTKRLIKTKKDHRQLRAVLDESTVTLDIPANGALTAGVVGQAYSKSIAPSNAIGAIICDIVSGSLPTGLSLNATTGLISGTPSAVASAKAVSIRVTDAFGNTKTGAYTITITAE